MIKKECSAKIVCTMGPSCWERGRVKALAEAGMDVARLNFSHGDYESHERTINTVRAVEVELNTPIATLLDTKGPEIRTGTIDGSGSVKLEAGQSFTLYLEKRGGDASGVSIDYPDLYKEISAGQEIYIDDGEIALVVESADENGIKCRVTVGGELGEKKGVNVPGASLSVPTLTERDVNDILWGIEHEVDFIAVSFVRTGADIAGVRRVLDGRSAGTGVIAKIETRQSVANIDEIIDAVDGIMIARGDLGVEINTEDVPMVQKEIIEKCRRLGKPVIVATQMLDSMIRSPRPTRAEASDVANAVIDGADAVMLSGETASGKYPVEAVRMMNKIVVRAESEIDEWQRTPKARSGSSETADAVSRAARDIAEMLGSAAILSLTRSGATARMISKYRPKCRLIALTPSVGTWRSLALVWGVRPFICPFTTDVAESASDALSTVLREGLVRVGDNVVFTSGIPFGVPGSTNLVNVYTVSEDSSIFLS